MVKNSPHRNTSEMQKSARCGAKTRKGSACRSPYVSGKKRCSMHGGAEGSGAPKGNQNALKHGMFTKENLAFKRYLKTLNNQSREILDEVNS